MCPIHAEKQRPQKRTEDFGNSSRPTDSYASPSYAPSGLSNRTAVMMVGIMLSLSGRGRGMRHLGRMMERSGMRNPLGTDMLRMTSMMSRDFSTTPPQRPRLPSAPPGAESATNRFLVPFGPGPQGSGWRGSNAWKMGLGGLAGLVALGGGAWATSHMLHDKGWQPPVVDPELLEEYSRLFEEHGIPRGDIDPGRDTAQTIIMSNPQGLVSDPVLTFNRDIGGQPEFVLQIAKQWADMGRNVIIVARDFKIHEEDTRRKNRTDNQVISREFYEPNSAYLNAPPRVERFTDNNEPGKGNVWSIRIPSTGGPVREHRNYDDMAIRSPSPYGTMTDRGRFVWKVDLWSHLPELSEATTAIGQLSGTDVIVGNWADGMGLAANVAARLEIPAAHIVHAPAFQKLNTSAIGGRKQIKEVNPLEYEVKRIKKQIAELEQSETPDMEQIGARRQRLSPMQMKIRALAEEVKQLKDLDQPLPYDADLLSNTEFVARTRLAHELYSLAAGNHEIANSPDEYEEFVKHVPNFALTTPESQTTFTPAGAAPIFYRERGDYDYTEADEKLYKYPPGVAAKQTQMGKDIIEKYGLEEKKYILFWGRKTPEKGADRMVVVIAELHNMGYTDMKALIIGSGTDIVVEKAKQLGLKVNEKDDEGGSDLDIIMVGPKRHPTIKVLIDPALAFTSFSLKEAFGMSIGEAMATGVPSLINRVTGIAKFIEDQDQDKKAGYIIDGDNPKQSTEILANLIEDPELWERIGKGGKEFAGQFTWEGIAKRQLGIFDRLRAEKASAKPSSQALLPTWRGSSWSWDSPMQEHLTKEAKRFFAEFPVDRVSKGRRFVVSVSGNEGIREFADLLARMMGRVDLVGQAMPVDADPDNPLSQWRIHRILKQAKRKDSDEVGVPSYTPMLERHYPYVPVYLSGVDVIVLESRHPVRSDLVDFHFELRDT